MKFLLTIGLALLAVTGVWAAQEPETADHELIFEIDFDRARELGWGTESTGDGEIQARVIARLAERFERSDLAPGAEVGRAKAAVRIRVPAVTEERAKRIERVVVALELIEFLIVAQEGEFEVAKERAKLEAWLEADAERRIVDFNLVAEADGGADPRLDWYPKTPHPPRYGRKQSRLDLATPVIVPAKEMQRFGAADFSRIYPTTDRLGYPAFGFEFHESRRADFFEFTGNNAHRLMAILVHGEVRSDPSIDEPLPGGGIIRGYFTEEYVAKLVRDLRSDTLGGALRLVETKRSR